MKLFLIELFLSAMYSDYFDTKFVGCIANLITHFTIFVWAIVIPVRQIRGSNHPLFDPPRFSLFVDKTMTFSTLRNMKRRFLSNLSQHVEAIVIGAGAIGLASARALAMAGKDVLIIERDSHIGSGEFAPCLFLE